MNDVIEARFTRQMESLANNLDQWYGASNAALQKIAIQEYYGDFPGSVILDVGNGGVTPEEQLGPELAQKVARFIGADKSSEMLHRAGSYEKLFCDGADIPLEDNSVDYCLLNNVIHHVGFRKNEGYGNAAKKVLRECLRVARKGIIIVEMTVPRPAQYVEQAIVSLSGGMAIFVFNANKLHQLLQEIGDVEILKFTKHPLRELVGPWTLYRGMIVLPIRVPAMLIPYNYVFCEVRKR